MFVFMIKLHFCNFVYILKKKKKKKKTMTVICNHLDKMCFANLFHGTAKSRRKWTYEYNFAYDKT